MAREEVLDAARERAASAALQAFSSAVPGCLRPAARASTPSRGRRASSRTRRCSTRAAVRRSTRPGSTSSTRRSWTAETCARAQWPACAASRTRSHSRGSSWNDRRTCFLRAPVPSNSRPRKASSSSRPSTFAPRKLGKPSRGRGRAQAPRANQHGTVGAVALDLHGDLAAATSTGGLTNKLPGRVGDSAVIGAGTYASNSSCAVSCTGTRRVLHSCDSCARHLRARGVRPHRCSRGDAARDRAPSRADRRPRRRDRRRSERAASFANSTRTSCTAVP